MAYLQFWVKDDEMKCGGFLVRQDFVLTAAHCNGSSISVTLGAHNIKQRERTQQVIRVRRAIPHPDYNPEDISNDIMLLKLERKAKQTSAVKPLSLPRAMAQVKPGQTCSVAGWGKDSMNTYPETLQEVKLIVQEDRKSIEVILGAHDIKKKERTQQVIRVRRAIPHPGYNSETDVNDLMLLQLERKAKVTTSVSTIRLPSGSDTVKPGMLCSVAGWGLLSVNGPTANKLQEVELEVQRDEECKAHYKHYNTNIQICVGNPRMRKNAMKGDSGGPLVCNGVAQGIVSYGADTPPDIYTRISRFQQWIKETMKMYKLQGPD
ncbi:hypothetical protein G4228_009734 [Cervus hanglu yarkandensis]|nr:hypothetical protein G4228_009734 [Cervus hanglu yarkandensis]